MTSKKAKFMYIEGMSENVLKPKIQILTSTISIHMLCDTKKNTFYVQQKKLSTGHFKIKDVYIYIYIYIYINIYIYIYIYIKNHYWHTRSM